MGSSLRRGALLLVLAGTGLGAAPTGQAPGSSFPAEIEVVTVDVVVMDKQGRSTPGLTRDDFLVSEDGVPQSVTSFEAVVVPETAPPPLVRPVVSTNVKPHQQPGRSFIVLFDDIHLTPTQAYRAKLAVNEFLRTGARAGDNVTLVASSGSAWWSASLPEGQGELMSILKRLDGRYIPDSSPDRVTDYEAMRIVVYDDVQVARIVSRRFDSLGALSRQRESNQGTRPGDTYENEAMRIDPLVRSRAEETYQLAKSRNTITLGVMARALRSLTDAKGRKSMILVSQGFVNDTELKQLRDVVEASRRANVPIYFLNTNGLSSITPFAGADVGRPIESGDYIVTVADMTRESDGSDNLALDTGGFVVRNTNDLAGGIARISNESRAFYLLGYVPTKATRDGKFRKIQVKLKSERKDLSVRARRGYYAPRDLDPAAPKDKEALSPAEAAVEHAVDSPIDLPDVPLRVTAYVFDESSVGRANVTVASEVDISKFGFEESEGRLNGAIELLVVAQQRETGEYFRYSQEVQMALLPATKAKLQHTWYLVPRDFELPVGTYQARVVARDKKTGRIGSVTHSFEIPALGSFRVSSPILSDQVETAGAGASPKPVLLARRFFGPGTLYCQYTVFGAEKDPATHSPRVTAGWEIRRAGGGILRGADPTPITPTSLGAVMRFMGLNLASAPPGSYELVLKVKDEIAGRTVEEVEPFSLAPVGS